MYESSLCIKQYLSVINSDVRNQEGTAYCFVIDIQLQTQNITEKPEDGPASTGKNQWSVASSHCKWRKR